MNSATAAAPPLLSLAEVRQALGRLGVDCTTPGLRGKARHEELIRRYHQISDRSAGRNSGAGHGKANLLKASVDQWSMSDLREALKVRRFDAPAGTAAKVSNDVNKFSQVSGKRKARMHQQLVSLLFLFFWGGRGGWGVQSEA